MTDNVSSDPKPTEGVVASTVDNNDYKAMAANAQSGNDKYVALKTRFGENIDEQLERLHTFTAQLEDDPEGTIAVLTEQAGIKPKPIQNQASQESEILNPYDFDKPDSYSGQKLAQLVDKRAGEIIDARLERADKMRELRGMQNVLAQKGITDEVKQRQLIKKFYNPTMDFGGFLDGELSQRPLQPGVMQQVEHNQSIQPTAAVLTSGGEPIITDDEMVKKAVRDARGASKKAFK